VPAIRNLDADGAAVDVARARPAADARMPGAQMLRHHPRDAPALVDKIMRRNFRVAIAQPVERGFGARHAGVVQQQNIGRASFRAFVEIRRRPFVAGKCH